VEGVVYGYEIPEVRILVTQSHKVGVAVQVAWGQYPIFTSFCTLSSIEDPIACLLVHRVLVSILLAYYYVNIYNILKYTMYLSCLAFR
jgi:hypothetical protein